MQTTKLFCVKFFPVIAHRPGIPDSKPMECNVCADTGDLAVEKVRSACSGFGKPFELVSVNPVEDRRGDNVVVYEFSETEFEPASLPRVETEPVDVLNDFAVAEDGPSKKDVPTGTANHTPIKAILNAGKPNA